MVEGLARSVILCGTIEVFSQQMLAYFPPRTEESLAPIDILYARYIPEHLRIEIFINRIRADAPRFKSHFLDLLTVVRIHEYAHAVVHVGINAADVAEQLANVGAGGTTDWEAFRGDRDRAFSALDDESGEFLAQAITWACISEEPASPRSQRLIETFLALEEHQPQRYRLPPGVKQRAGIADWGVVLRAAQGGLDLYREPSFKLAAGLAELIRKSGEPREEAEIRPNDLLTSFVSELQQRLATVDLASSGTVPGDNTLKLLVLRKESVELQMYKEAAHHRPHFHLEYKTEFRASYALDNFERLAGYMPRKYEDVILPIARDNQTQLIDRWRSLNGTARVSLPASNA